MTTTLTDHISGVWCASLTPLANDGGLDAPALTAHVQRLLRAGIDGVAPFGTTGEGQSFSVDERRRGVDALLSAGIPARAVLPATGCAALPDTIALTRHALENGCAGALVLPPFFYTDVSDDGLYASYAQLIEAVGDARLRLYLYHIPQISGVALSPALITRLVQAFPGIVAGIKDSEGKLQHSRRLRARFPQLAIFVGHEAHLPAMLAEGGAGTICGMANLFPRLIRRLHDGAGSVQEIELERVERFVAHLGSYPIFAAFKAIQATLLGDARWHALRPPLVALDPAQLPALMAMVAAAGIDAGRDGG